jgi:hypothetical protein
MDMAEEQSNKVIAKWPHLALDSVRDLLLGSFDVIWMFYP